MNESKRSDGRQWRKQYRSGAMGSPRHLTRNDYDTLDGIRRHVTTLAGLNAVIDARRSAHYDRQEELIEVWLFGRMRSDSFGNAMIASGALIPGELFPDIPSVLTNPGMSRFLMSKGLDRESIWITTGMGGSGTFTVARPFEACAVCGKTWDIGDCFDCIANHEDFTVPVDRRFYGKTLADLRVHLHQNGAGRLHPEAPIQNDCYIDLRPNPRHPTLRMNEGGWPRDLAPDYVIRKGDRMFLYRWTFEHPPCRTKRIAAQMERYFHDLIAKAGFDMGQTQWLAIPNGRAPETEHYNGPWFRVMTEVGELTIGWRKRVIHLGWGTDKDLSHLFLGEQTTVAADHVHAWGEDKATDYLTRIRRQLAAA